MSVRVTAEADSRQGAGHAVIMVEGANLAPDGIRYVVRRPGYREDTLGPNGWQAAEAQLVPQAAYVAQGALILHVGPDMVAHMEPGMNVAFCLLLPDGAMVDARLAWPAIAGPIGGAGARRGRMVATRRAASEAPMLRSGGALVGDVADIALDGQPDAVERPAEPAVAHEPMRSEPAAMPADRDPPALDQASAPQGDAVVEDHAEPAAAPVAPDLRAERDAAPQQEIRRRGPWKRRVAVTASIAILLVGGAAAAAVYLGRDQICLDESFGGVADDWGLCSAVVVAETADREIPTGAAEEPAAEGSGWNIDPLAWLGPLQPSVNDSDAPDAEPTDEPAMADPPTPESQRALARQYLETQPTPADAFARATDLLAEGQVEAAFLIFRYAAERGSADAASAVAAMYDPETYTPQSSPLPRPNPSVARIWYERAVAAGDNEALLHLARLLAAEDEVEDAREALRRAEEAGLVDAVSRMLEELE